MRVIDPFCLLYGYWPIFFAQEFFAVKKVFKRKSIAVLRLLVSLTLCVWSLIIENIVYLFIYLLIIFIDVILPEITVFITCFF